MIDFWTELLQTYSIFSPNRCNRWKTITEGSQPPSVASVPGDGPRVRLRLPHRHARLCFGCRRLPVLLRSHDRLSTPLAQLRVVWARRRNLVVEPEASVAFPVPPFPQRSPSRQPRRQLRAGRRRRPAREGANDEPASLCREPPPGGVQANYVAVRLEGQARRPGRQAGSWQLHPLSEQPGLRDGDGHDAGVDWSDAQRITAEWSGEQAEDQDEGRDRLKRGAVIMNSIFLSAKLSSNLSSVTWNCFVASFLADQNVVLCSFNSKCCKIFWVLTSHNCSDSLIMSSQKSATSYSWLFIVPPDHLLLDRSPNIGPLISRWELDKFKNCWNKTFRTSKILTILYQIFSNLLIAQRDMSGPRLGALSNNRWSGVAM